MTRDSEATPLAGKKIAHIGRRNLERGKKV
jgi:hypothetical protein